MMGEKVLGGIKLEQEVLEAAYAQNEHRNVLLKGDYDEGNTEGKALVADLVRHREATEAIRRLHQSPALDGVELVLAYKDVWIALVRYKGSST